MTALTAVASNEIPTYVNSILKTHAACPASDSNPVFSHFPDAAPSSSGIFTLDLPVGCRGKSVGRISYEYINISSVGKSSPVVRTRGGGGGLRMVGGVGQTSVNYGGRKTFTAWLRRKASLFSLLSLFISLCVFFRPLFIGYQVTRTRTYIEYSFFFPPFPGES